MSVLVVEVNNVLIFNNQSSKPTTLKHTNLVYEFKCNLGECELLSSSYIGLTTTILSRRLTMHLAGGAIKSHIHEKTQLCSYKRNSCK